MHPPLATTLSSGWNGLSLYVLGPGVGECQVLLMPDGRVIVVDACTKGGRNFGVALLQALGVAHVDLFVLTHPDRDHVKGAADFLRRYPPDRVWLYPEHASLRWVLVEAKRRARDLGVSVSDAFRDLTEFGDALDAFKEQQPRRVEHIRGTREAWTFAGSPYAVKPIAPTEDDEQRAGAMFANLQTLPERKGAEYIAWVENFLDDGTRAKDEPNKLSIALSIECWGRRLLLGGDVEHGNGNPRYGWEGVFLSLQERNLSHVLRALDVVKVSHHGSLGAIHDPSWREHRRGGAPSWGVIAPFRGQSEKLPRHDGLEKLRSFGPRLAITHTSADTRAAAVAAGWVEDTSLVKQPEDFPMVALRVLEAGPVEVSVWGDASVWRP